MTKISVIVPVYNTEKYLEKCLDSLATQTLRDIEIIIVNDGSPDNSQKIIEKFTKKYDNMKSFVKENGGLSSARNYGLTKAQGEYISFIDSDDYIKKNMLEKMYTKAQKDKSDIVTCDFINLYEDGHEVNMKSNFHYSVSELQNYLISPPMVCTRIYKKELFTKIKFKENTYYEDLELTPKLLLYTEKVSFLEEPLYYYFQRNGSIMKQEVFNDKLLDIFDVLSSNYQKLSKLYPNEIEYMYITHLLRSTSLRFLDYEETEKYLEKINNEMKDKFPQWRKNIYYKKSSYKLKIICNLAFTKNYWILRIIKKKFNR